MLSAALGGLDVALGLGVRSQAGRVAFGGGGVFGWSWHPLKPQKKHPLFVVVVFVFVVGLVFCVFFFFGGGGPTLKTGRPVCALSGATSFGVGDADSFKGEVSLQSIPNHQDTVRLNEIHLSATQCPSLSCECQTHQRHPTQTNKPKTKTRDAGKQHSTFNSCRVALLPLPPPRQTKQKKKCLPTSFRQALAAVRSKRSRLQAEMRSGERHGLGDTRFETWSVTSGFPGFYVHMFLQTSPLRNQGKCGGP